jgi:hypothetical protein
MKIEQAPNFLFVTGRLNPDEDEWNGLRIRAYRDSFNLYFGELFRVWIGIEKRGPFVFVSSILDRNKKCYNSLWETLKEGENEN